jgi:GTP cyclohydrolase I
MKKKESKKFLGLPGEMAMLPLPDHLETPLVAESFVVPESEKVEKIAHHVKEILKTLGLNVEDPSLKDTPRRVAEMYVYELFRGLDLTNKPEVRLFPNQYGYQEPVIQCNISVKSVCEHHLVPFLGVAHVGYMPGDHVIGLSKLNRIVDFYSRRPQVQERLTNQIAFELKRILHTEDVFVIIEAEHFCVKIRGIQDQDALTITSHFSGIFQSQDMKNFVWQFVKRKS